MNIGFNVFAKTHSHIVQNPIVSSIKKFGKVLGTSDNKEQVAATMKLSAEGRKKVRSLEEDSVEKLEEKYYESQKEKYRNERDELVSILDQLKKNCQDMVGSTKRKMTKETEMDRIEAEEQLRQLKEEQEALYAAKEKDAKEITMQASKQQLNEQKGYADLYLIKKSLEESKETEEERKQKEAKNGDVEAQDIKDVFGNSEEAEEFNTADALDSIGSEISRISSTAEKRMDETIQRMTDKYQKRFDKVEAFTKDFSEALDAVYKMVDDERYTDEQKMDAITKFSHSSMERMVEIQDERAIALEIKNNVHHLKMSRMASNNMEIASRYVDSVDEMSDWIEKLDYMKDYVEDAKDEEEEYYKEAIEEIDENAPVEEENNDSENAATVNVEKEAEKEEQEE